MENEEKKRGRGNPRSKIKTKYIQIRCTPNENAKFKAIGGSKAVISFINSEFEKAQLKLT